jgi:type VI secretion system secreted protein VgrG
MALPEIDVAFGCGDAPWTVLVARIREEISALYEADVIVSSALDAPPPDAMLGQPAVLELTRAGTVRRLKGVVRRVEDLGSTASHRFAKVVVVPRLWALTQRVDTRIFQEMPVVDIVRAVVQGAVLYTGENELRFPGALAQHPAREYCVQYGESDLKFAMRLLQEEGVAHYFTHDGEGTEALHLAEDGHTYPEVDVMGGGPTVDVVDANAATVSREGVTMFQLGSELRPTGLMIRDYDFTRPRAMLDMSPSFPSERGGRPMYEYPSRVSLYEYDDETRAYPMHDGGRQARVRFEAQQVAGRVGSGRGLVTAFIPGAVFELHGHLRSELDQRYLLLSVEHRVRAFDTIPEEVRLSRTLLAQTARVVGPAGEDIHTTRTAASRCSFTGTASGARTTRARAGSAWRRAGRRGLGLRVHPAHRDGGGGHLPRGRPRPPRWSRAASTTARTTRPTSSPRRRPRARSRRGARRRRAATTSCASKTSPARSRCTSRPSATTTRW